MPLGSELSTVSPLPVARKSQRICLQAKVYLRRTGGTPFSVEVHDLSLHGCKVHCREHLRLDDALWVKFDTLQAISASACWVEDEYVGLEFERPLHIAVFDMLVKRLGSKPRA